MSQKSKSFATPRSSASARDRMAQLAVAAGDEGALRSHGDDVLEVRVVQVGLGYGGLLQRDRPLDGELGVGEVHEGVGLLQFKGPVGVHR